jgi:L-fuconolactonase
VRIDAHHHVWDLADRPQPWTTDIPQLNKSFTIDELRPELQLHRIDGIPAC